MFALFNFTLKDVNEVDLFNKQNSRTQDEILENPEEYNCMSYAFGAYEWLLPFDHCERTYDILDELDIQPSLSTVKEIRDCLEDWGYNHPILIKLAIERMLETFPDLRRIKSFDELKEDEYGIVYATSWTGDFHFGRYEDGQWSHKQGWSPVAQVESEDEVFGMRYNGKGFRFAMKKGEVRIEC